MKRIGLITLIVVCALSIGEVVFDIADVKCKKFEPAPIGYPVRICSITFDDKGIVGRVID